MIATRDDAFLEVKAMLQAHIDVLKHHLMYLTQISNNGVSDADIIDYLNELFNLRYQHNNKNNDDVVKKFKTKYLPVLIASIKTRYASYLKISQLASDTNEDAAKSTLAIALQYEMFYADLDQKALNKRPTMTIKILTALHGIDFLKSISESLHPILPAYHANIAQCISLETREKKGTLAYAGINYRWNSLNEHTRELVTKMMQGQKNMPSFNSVMGDHSKTGQIEGWYEYMDTFIKNLTHFTAEEVDLCMLKSELVYTKITDQIKLVTKHNLEETPSNTLNGKMLDFLLLNVKFFYDIYPDVAKQQLCLNQVIHVTSNVRKETQRIHQLKTKFDRMSKKVQGEMRSLHEQISAITISSKLKSMNDDDINRYTVNILDAVRECNVHAKVFSQSFTLTTDIQEVEASMLQYQRCYHEVITSVREFKAALDHCVQAEKKAAAEKSEELLRNQESARQALLAEAKRKNEEYKNRVDKERKEKEASKQSNRFFTPAATPTVTVYKNTSMEERLCNLNKDGIKVLTALFNFEKNVRYADVCRVITQQLGGEIKEVGNGSSHKRIILDKYLIELTAHEGFEDEKVLEKSSLATGGMFKQHGEAHQSGVMVRFNMELVVTTLKRAGITLDVLQRLTSDNLCKN